MASGEHSCKVGKRLLASSESKISSKEGPAKTSRAHVFTCACLSSYVYSYNLLYSFSGLLGMVGVGWPSNLGFGSILLLLSDFERNLPGTQTNEEEPWTYGNFSFTSQKRSEKEWA